MLLKGKREKEVKNVGLHIRGREENGRRKKGLYFSSPTFETKKKKKEKEHGAYTGEKAGGRNPQFDTPKEKKRKVMRP